MSMLWVYGHHKYFNQNHKSKLQVGSLSEDVGGKMSKLIRDSDRANGKRLLLPAYSETDSGLPLPLCSHYTEV